MTGIQSTVPLDRNRSGFSSVDDDELSASVETSLHSDWRYENNCPRIIFSPYKQFIPSFQTRGNRTPINPTQLHLLRKGDHVGWHRTYFIWHHAIVTDIDIENKRIEVIHFTKTEDGNFTVEDEWLDVTEQDGDFFRFNYPEERSMFSSTGHVLKRARGQLGQTDYSIFGNNCEHFATYCKTGKRDSFQVRWFFKIIAETMTTIAALSQTLIRSVTNQIMNQGYRGVIHITAEVGGAEAVEHVSEASNWVGAGIVAAVETVHLGYDLYQMYEHKKAEKITDEDFKQCTTQRISEGICGGGSVIGLSIAGGALGGVIGGAMGSVTPVVGTALGSYLGSLGGGFLGSVLGKACGSMFGHWLGRKLFKLC